MGPGGPAAFPASMDAAGRRAAPRMPAILSGFQFMFLLRAL